MALRFILVGVCGDEKLFLKAFYLNFRKFDRVNLIQPISTVASSQINFSRLHTNRNRLALLHFPAYSSFFTSSSQGPKMKWVGDLQTKRPWPWPWRTRWLGTRMFLTYGNR
jgi:hypothetical protein